MDFTFLICTERCGSNLVTRMMDSHPEVCGPPPSHVVRTFAQNVQRYGDLRDGSCWDDLTGDVADLLRHQLGTWRTRPSAEEIREGVAERSLGAVLRFVFEAEAAAHGKSRLFVKENQTWRFLPYLLLAFPGARFVYLVRDPRDMALSWQRSPSHPGGVLEGAEVWQRDQEASILCYGFLKQSGRVHLLRYEDLISAPEQEGERLCAFLGMPFDPGILEFHSSDSTRLNAARLRDWENLKQPVLGTNKGKYVGAMSELEIRYVEARCAVEMAFFDYRPDHPPGDPRELGARLPISDRRAAASVEDEEDEIRQRRLAILRRILERPLRP